MVNSLKSPASWSVIESPSEVFFTHSVVDADHETLARVCRLSRALGRERDESENAKLMAAAPQLLTYLQSCVEILEARGISDPQVQEAKRLINAVLSRPIMAIRG